MIQNQIQLFQSNDGHVSLEVSLNNDTVWLSLDPMVSLFGRDKSVISQAIGELKRELIYICFTLRVSLSEISIIISDKKRFLIN